MTSSKPKFKRILLKIGGESLMGREGYGLSLEMARKIASEIREVHDLGIEIALVMGGGNIIRGGALAKDGGVNKATAKLLFLDY